MLLEFGNPNKGKYNGARYGWEAAFQTMAERGEDELLDSAMPLENGWDEDEWEW